jgi:hypothetical protein
LIFQNVIVNSKKPCPYGEKFASTAEVVRYLHPNIATMQ